MKRSMVLGLMVMVVVALLLTPASATDYGTAKVIKRAEMWQDTLTETVDTTTAGFINAIKTKDMPYNAWSFRFRVDSLQDSTAWDEDEGDQEPADSLFFQYSYKYHTNHSWAAWADLDTFLAAEQTAFSVWTTIEIPLWTTTTATSQDSATFVSDTTIIHSSTVTSIVSAFTEKPDWIKFRAYVVDADSCVVPLQGVFIAQ